MKKLLLAIACFVMAGLPAAAQSSHSVTLSWTQSTSTGVTTNNVYRATTSGGPYAVIYSSAAPATTYTDNSVASGSTYYYVVTALVGSEESAYSNQVTAVIPANPNPPTGLNATKVQ